MKVLVMGLGLHGGGLESARYLARRGAEVTVTDLRDEKTLAPSIEKLEAPGERPAFPLRYVLGRHETADFRRTGMVIKNPGVNPGSPYLAAAREAGALIETDISIFLAESPARLLAVTGSKGKSSAASALHWALAAAREERRAAPEKGGPGPEGGSPEAPGPATAGTALPGRAWLGGNITVSPLVFLDELTAADDVVLELSSWQLGDLRGRKGGAAAVGGALLKPRCAVLTAIMPDHLDRYGTMEAYVADKRVIYQGQGQEDLTVAGDDKWGESFRRESPGRSLVYGESPLPEGVPGGWLAGPGGPGLARLRDSPPPGIRPVTRTGETVEVVPSRLLTPGRHQKKNLLAAALALLDLGLPPPFIRESLGRFPGIPHRLEFFHEAGGVRFYNDSAATIPEAAAAALASFDGPVILVAGGADKRLDFGPLARAAAGARAIVLLAGTASEKLKSLLAGRGIPCRGPFDDLDRAVQAALEAAVPGDTVVLSPGCASFGMFLNEFDRGGRWKEAVRRLA
ncbi:MAG: UDP-N-acetylmuramoyl-L-alanine--D-glutamate ligase [Treponema sp.]|jgi:UDP-N-acetylmuramoylalanine--D-glutamate ligase|nr:UDP-N-acetylmuramoyl-L-alanine--D-glutamate ligase [Treponema sp.]